MQRILLSLALLTISHWSQAFEPCRIDGYSHAIECENIEVAENETLGIAIHRVASTVRYPKPEPIIWIPNNLSVDSTRIAPNKIRTFRRVRHHRHFLWLSIQQDKQPLMSCEKVQDRLTQLHRNKSITDRLFPLNQAVDLRDCQQALNRKQINQISPSNLATYYEAMRQQLGLEKVVVIAEGRGADVALAWQKRNPESIKFQVFDSPVFSPNDTDNRQKSSIKMAQLLSQIMTACKQDDGCKLVVNHPNMLLNKLIASLPQNVSMRNALTHQNEVVTIDESLLYVGLSRLLNIPEKAVLLPSALQQALNHNWQPFIGLLSLNWRKQLSGQNIGAFLAQTCLGYSPKRQTKAGNWFYTQHDKQLARLCTGLDLQENQIKQLYKNSIPTLSVIGGFQFSSLAPEYIDSNETVVNVPNGGYHLLGKGCARDVLYRYFILQDNLAADAEIDANALRAECLVDMPYPNINIQFEATQ